MNLYQELLMDHYRNPRNRGSLEKPDISSGMVNPSCGDAVSMQATIKDGHIVACRFEGAGCVISQATASMLTEKASGSSIQEVEALDGAEMQKLIGMELGPTRLKCALLPLEALKKGLNSA